MKNRTLLTSKNQDGNVNPLHTYLNDNKTYCQCVAMIEKRSMIFGSEGLLVTIFDGTLFVPTFAHKKLIGTFQNGTFTYASGRNAATIESLRLVLSHYPTIVFQKVDDSDSIKLYCI